MDYSLESYLNRLSIKELKMILRFCKEHCGDYENIVNDIYEILDTKNKNKA